MIHSDQIEERNGSMKPPERVYLFPENQYAWWPGTDEDPALVEYVRADLCARERDAALSRAEAAEKETYRLSRILAEKSDRLVEIERQAEDATEYALASMLRREKERAEALEAENRRFREALEQCAQPGGRQLVARAALEDKIPPAFSRAVCRGSIALGTACGNCERCDWERKRLAGLKGA